MQITVSSIREAAPDKKIDLLVRYINDVETDGELSVEQELVTVSMIISCKQAGIALGKWSDLIYIPPDKGYNAYEYLRDYYGIDTNLPMSAAELYEKYPGLFHDSSAADEEELYSWYNALTIRIMVKLSDEIKHSEGKAKEIARQIEAVEQWSQVKSAKPAKKSDTEETAEPTKKIWGAEKAEVTDAAVREAMEKSAIAAAKAERTKSKKRTKTSTKNGKRHPVTHRYPVKNKDADSHMTTSTIEGMSIKPSSAIFNRWVYPDKLDEFCERRRKRIEGIFYRKRENL